MAYRKKTLAYIRQLCSIGLGAESIMPSLLIAIRDAIPCRGAAFFFLDERFDITNVYFDDIQSIKILSVYLTEYMNKLEVPEWVDFPNMFEPIAASVTGEVKSLLPFT